MTNSHPGSPDEARTAASPPPPTEPTQVTPTVQQPHGWQSGPDQSGAPQQGSTNSFMVALSDQLTVLARLGKGKTVEALETAARSPLMWVVTLVAGAVLTGLLFATTLARMSGSAMSTLTSFLGGSSVYFGMTFGAWFAMFIMAIVLVGIVMSLRVVALHLTFKMAGNPQPFRTSMSATATAYSIHLPVMAAMLILMLIPGSSWVMIVSALGAYLWLLCGLFSELIMYIGLNRATAFGASPLRMHAIATAVWIAAVAIIYFLAFMITGDMATNALGGLL